MEWVENESFGLGSPAFADEFVGREAFEGLQSSPEGVSADEVGQMLREVVVVVVVEAFDGRRLDGAVHAFDLTATRENSPPDCFLILAVPRVLWLGCAMLDAARRAGAFEGVRPDGFALGEGAQTGSPLARASATSCAADPPAPGVVKWVPLSVSTMLILQGTAWARCRRKSPAVLRRALR